MWSLVFLSHVYVFLVECFVLLLEACIDVAFFGTFSCHEINVHIPIFSATIELFSNGTSCRVSNKLEAQLSGIYRSCDDECGDIGTSSCRGGWEANQKAWRVEPRLAEFQFGVSSCLLSTISIIPLYHTPLNHAFIRIISCFSTINDRPTSLHSQFHILINHNVFSGAFNALESRFDTSR